MTKKLTKKYKTALIILALLSMYLVSGMFLRLLGRIIIVDDPPAPSDAIVVLNSGMEYYPRLIEAADLYNRGFGEKIVLNGNRKTDTYRLLEKKGFIPCCPWCEDRLRVLALFRVPRDRVICVGAEDAYDTVSEAEAVGSEIIKMGIRKVIITTSKYHSRRARHIWVKAWADKISILMVSAKSDPFDPSSWWEKGRQIRWVLAEYGAWIYYWWKSVMVHPDKTHQERAKIQKVIL